MDKSVGKETLEGNFMVTATGFDLILVKTVLDTTFFIKYYLFQSTSFRTRTLILNSDNGYLKSMLVVMVLMVGFYLLVMTIQ